MNGIWILLLLILSAALPVIIVLFWFRAGKSAVSMPWFLASLASGILSLHAAALIQKLIFSPGRNGPNELGAVFFNVFFRIALVEEAARLLILFPLIKAGSRRRNMDSAFTASLGLAAGLGFAMLESASYGIADISIALLRAFSAAPLHGACGIRAGTAVFFAPKNPVKALFLFITAVFIHGAYNLMIVSPALPSLLALPIAFSALFASLHLLKAGREDDNSPISAPHKP